MRPPRSPRHGRLQRDTLLLLATETFYKASGFALLVVLSRCLPARDIGAYFFALSFAESFLVLTSFYLNPVLMRRVAADPARAPAHLSPFLGFRLLSGPLYLLCVSAAAVTFVGETWRVVVAVALFTLLENIYFSFADFFLALGKVVYNVGISVTVQAFFLAVFLLGMWWAPSLGTLVAANLLRSLALLGTAVFVTHRRLCPLWVSWDSGFLKEGVPFILLTLLVMLQENVSTLLLGFLTNYDTVGHYHLAFRIVFASFFIPASVGLVFFPKLAADGLSVENRYTLVRGSGVLVGLGLLAMGVVFFGAAPLTRVLYGPLADAVGALLRPLALLIPLGFLSLYLSSALLALHQETRILQATAVVTGVSFLASYALIPRWGAYGAVYAQVCSSAIEVGIITWYVWRLFACPQPLAAQQRESKNLALPVAGLE